MQATRHHWFTGALLASVMGLAPLSGRSELPDAPPAPEGRVMLPQDHAYQKVLRNHLATLIEQDFGTELIEELYALL